MGQDEERQGYGYGSDYGHEEGRLIPPSPRTGASQAEYNIQYCTTTGFIPQELVPSHRRGKAGRNLLATRYRKQSIRRDKKTQLSLLQNKT